VRGGILLLAVLLGACAHRAGVTAAPPADWRARATAPDRQRLTSARAAWVDALRQAHAADAPLAAEGALFDMDAALDDPVPPAGRYRCRTFKLGAKSAGLSAFLAYPWFACRVTQGADGAKLEKLTGSQRQAGRILPAAPRRAVFLGTLALGDERGQVRYGRDRARDVAGWVERIGAARWRVAMPYPAYESVLDVLELVPAA
jgi:hypothetical protein